MEILVGIGVFILTALMIGEAQFVVKAIWKPELRQIQKRLRTFSSSLYSNENIDLLKKKNLS